MPHIVFVAPRFLENTNRYVRAFAQLDITLSVVSSDPEPAIPAGLRKRIAGHYRVADTLDVAQLAHAVRAIQQSIGPVDRLAGVLEQLQTPMAAVREALGIEGLRPAAARNFRDKDRMKAVLRGAGVPVARSVLARSLDGIRAFVDEVGYPIIVKPQAGLGARSTSRVESAEQLAALPPPSDRAPVQVEEFVRAREHTCETVTVKGEPVWHSGTRYFPSPLEVLETPWVQYCVMLPREADAPPWSQFQPVNRAALAALFGDEAHTAAGTALSHMEWFLRDDGSSLVNEVGVRPPGVHIMPLMGLTHDTDLFADWARLIAFDAWTAKPRTSAAGAAFFRGHGGGTRVAKVAGIEAAVEIVGETLVEARFPKVGQPRAETYEGEGWAIVRHETTDGVKDALRTLVETVQVRYF